MAKGQQKSNKEVKKPKKVKAAPAVAAPFAKGSVAPDQPAKRKG
jgi:hypothetical protein